MRGYRDAGKAFIGKRWQAKVEAKAEVLMRAIRSPLSLKLHPQDLDDDAATLPCYPKPAGR
jgi:hypothetical protein